MRILAKPVSLALLLASEISAFAGVHAEYAGELRFNASGFPEPVPLIRVLTDDEHVRKITFQDRQRRPSRYMAFDFAGAYVIRFREYGLDREETNVDLLHASFLYPQEIERIASWGDLLLRHFNMKRGYKLVAAENRPIRAD